MGSCAREFPRIQTFRFRNSNRSFNGLGYRSVQSLFHWTLRCPTTSGRASPAYVRVMEIDCRTAAPGIRVVSLSKNDREAVDILETTAAGRGGVAANFLQGLSVLDLL